MFCVQRNDENANVGWNYMKMHPTWKSRWMHQKIFDEEFDREQTSSNIVQQDFFLFFPFFVFNFLSPQMYQTFRPTSKICNTGWNVGCICVGIKTANVMCKNKVKISKDGMNLLASYIACYQL